MSLPRPSHLTLAVSDLARSLGFWHGALGIPVKLRGDDWAELQSDGIVVTLCVRDVVQPGGIVGIEVDDLASEAARLRALGLALEPDDSEPREILGRRLALRDPDGHAVELRSYR